MSKNAFFGYKYVRAILVLLFLSFLLKLYFIKTIVILILVLEDIDFFSTAVTTNCQDYCQESKFNKSRTSLSYFILDWPGGTNAFITDKLDILTEAGNHTTREKLYYFIRISAFLWVLDFLTSCTAVGSSRTFGLTATNVNWGQVTHKTA